MYFMINTYAYIVSPEKATVGIYAPTLWVFFYFEITIAGWYVYFFAV